jgi:hypothetical protein
MAKKFIPNTAASGAQTPFDNIVGLQLVDGGGLTTGTFAFTTSIKEKVNRNFNIGKFSSGVSLENLDFDGLLESRELLAKEFRVYPNYDISQVTNFTLYGSLQKRLESSVTKILAYFPAAIEIDFKFYDLTTGNTAYDISYDSIEDETTLTINVNRLKNPFDIDYSVNSEINLSSREIEFAPIRDLTNEYLKYSLFVGENEYPLNLFTPSTTLSSGSIGLIVSGSPFGATATTTQQTLVIRPSSYYTRKAFSENFDEVERFLLNTLVRPKYTAIFDVPVESEGGGVVIQQQTLTWPIDGEWNLDIRTFRFDEYLTQLNTISEEFDSFKTNLIARFFTTEAFKEFDTDDQKVTKVLQLYGRNFDEVKKFIDALAYMNSVSYNTGNDIPSQLLKNLAQTLGWQTNISPITDQNFLDSVYGNLGPANYAGYSRQLTPTELNYNFYRNLILNSAYLFKSKGTRRSIEFTLRLVGAPESLVEFNEFVYLADQRINMSSFNNQYAQISGGTWVNETPTLDSTNVYTIQGVQYSGFTSTVQTFDIDTTLSDYPIDSQGFPKAPENTETFYFEKGAGWFESTPAHRSPEELNLTDSVFTGNNPSIQTNLQPFTYGQKYFDRFRDFPYMTLGFNLKKTIDNKKSWQPNQVGLRTSRTSGYNAYYKVTNEKLVLNAKNVDLFLNPSQGILYDIWELSRRFGAGTLLSGNSPLPAPYPQPGGPVDWTSVNPDPSRKTFFEFAQTFWLNMINARNRQWITDGKTSGYPTLTYVYWQYLTQTFGNGVNTPSDRLTYEKLIEYVDGLGPYWIRLTEQMVPASTIWNGGTRLENSIFNRQKFVYRRQRGCQIIPVPVTNCEAIGQLYGYDCTKEITDCPIYPWIGNTSSVTSLSDILYVTLNNFLTTQGKVLSQCVSNSLKSEWFVDFRYNGTPLIQSKFYTGYGLTDVPSNTAWKNALISSLTDLVNYGMYYSINGNTVSIYKLGCYDGSGSNSISINVGLNLNINCS